MNLFYIKCSILYLSVILFLTAFYLIIVIDFMFTGSIPGGLTATLALHKWRSKNASFKTPLYL